MNRHMPNMPKLLALLTLTILSACAPIKELPNPDQATAIEQFLITQAVDLSLNNENATPVPLQQGETVTLDTTDLTIEKRFFIGALGQWLGEQGLLLMPEARHANYRIQVLVQALGTEQSQSFFGMPAVQSVLIPFALPEITLYKAQYQRGYTRFRLDIFENTTGKFIRSTPWFEATTYFNEYTVFFFFNFHETNLLGPFDESTSSSTNQEHATDY
jgi:hypothetical protein